MSGSPREQALAIENVEFVKHEESKRQREREEEEKEWFRRATASTGTVSHYYMTKKRVK